MVCLVCCLSCICVFGYEVLTEVMQACVLRGVRPPAALGADAASTDGWPVCEGGGRPPSGGPRRPRPPPCAAQHPGGLAPDTFSIGGSARQLLLSAASGEPRGEQEVIGTGRGEEQAIGIRKQNKPKNVSSALVILTKAVPVAPTCLAWRFSSQ